jgi:hypothetical protein
MRHLVAQTTAGKKILIFNLSRADALFLNASQRPIFDGEALEHKSRTLKLRSAFEGSFNMAQKVILRRTDLKIPYDAS